MSVGRPTKRERRDLARQERERIRQRQRRRAQYRKAMAATSVLAAVGLIAVVFFLPKGGGGTTAAPPQGVKSFDVPSRNHVEGTVQYPQDPPVGGDHAGVWVNCGAYNQPLTNENVVHDLEHGAVSIEYQPTLPKDQVGTLNALANETFILVSPDPSLDSPVVATAWGRQLRLQSADDPGLQQFIRAFRQGPTTPELGAPCTGGITPGG